jgi:hypothetical protein
MVLQSVLFPKSKYTIAQAKKWMADNNYKVSLSKVDATDNFWRFTLAAKAKNGEHYQIKSVATGIKLVSYGQ